MFYKNLNNLVRKFFALSACLVFVACEDKPKEALDNILIDVGGYISFHNPVENLETGTVVGGTPSSLSYYAPGEECFPTRRIKREYIREHLNKKYVNSFQGNVGFLAWGTAAISGGVALRKDHLVVIEINGVTIEYMNAVDITKYYRNGMHDICKDYLDEFGFIVQAAMTDKLSIAIIDSTGVAIELDETNINEYLTIAGDMHWEILNDYRVEITTPHYLGYHLGQLRKADGEMIRYRARSAVDGRFHFEKDGSFDDGDTSRTESFRFRDDPATAHHFIPTP